MKRGFSPRVQNDLYVFSRSQLRSRGDDEVTSLPHFLVQSNNNFFSRETNMEMMQSRGEKKTW